MKKNILIEPIEYNPSLEYTIFGEPTPLLPYKPQILKKNHILGVSQHPDKQINIKETIKSQIHIQHGILPFYGGPISINMTFYMTQAQIYKNEYFYDRKPDLHDLQAMILHCSTGILYKDDNVICHLTSKKIYDPKPRTVFTITQL
jgi:Holliday junction resolvase RusA-like endonuclease